MKDMDIIGILHSNRTEQKPGIIFGHLPEGFTAAGDDPDILEAMSKEKRTNLLRCRFVRKGQ